MLGSSSAGAITTPQVNCHITHTNAATHAIMFGRSLGIIGWRRRNSGSSSSGSDIANPSALPRGTIETLCGRSTAGSSSPVSAWPAS